MKKTCKLNLKKTIDFKDPNKCYSLSDCERCDEHIKPCVNQFMGVPEEKKEG